MTNARNYFGKTKVIVKILLWSGYVYTPDSHTPSPLPPSSPPHSPPQDFSIEYHFSENEWFSNKVLVKSYTVSCEVDTDDPWSFEGAAITACTG